MVPIGSDVYGEFETEARRRLATVPDDVRSETEVLIDAARVSLLDDRDPAVQGLVEICTGHDVIPDQVDVCSRRVCGIWLARGLPGRLARQLRQTIGRLRRAFRNGVGSGRKIAAVLRVGRIVGARIASIIERELGRFRL